MFEFRQAERPYPGLRPFETYEAEVFFGREEHTDRLLEILQREHFLAVIGPSASGKSSLVRAGLLPGLAIGSLGTGSDWRIAVLRPGNRPMHSLAQALLRQEAFGRELLGEARGREGDDITAEVATMEAEFRRGPLGLRHVVQGARERLAAGAEPFNLLVLVDQFEELFTYADAGGTQADESEGFVNLLLGVRGAPDAGVHVALTMRTDFLGECVRFQELPEAINRAQYLTPRLTRPQMETAITAPARVFGGDIEPELVAELINDIGQNSDQLPILQHALARMWQVAEEKNGQSPLIDWAANDAVGGVQKALNQHGDAVLASLGAVEQQSAEALFRAVTRRRESDSGRQDVRRPLRLGRIAEWADRPWEAFAPVLEVFAAPDVCFLQVRGDAGADSIIDLSHEALIRQWGRLRAWVEDEAWRANEYRRWRERALEHADGGGNLLSGAQLARALEWWNPQPSEGHQWQPSARWSARYARVPVLAEGTAASAWSQEDFERTIDFIKGSQEEHKRLAAEQAAREQRELEVQTERARFAEERADLLRRQARRSRQLTVFLIGVTLVAVAFGVMALRAENSAQQASEEATIRRLASDSVAMLSSYRPGGDLSAMRIALAAYRIEPQIEALSSLQAMVNGSSKLLRAAEGLRGVRSVAYSADGLRIAAAGEDGLIRLWDAKSGSPIAPPLAGHRGAVSSVAFSEDGLRIASGGVDGTVRLWNAAGGAPIGQPLAGHEGAVLSVVFSVDGSRLASGGKDGTLRFWDPQSGAAVGPPLSGSGGPVSSLAFSSDGLRIVSAGFYGSLRLWDTSTGRPVGPPLEGHVGPVLSVAHSADGMRIVSAGADGALRLWNARRGEPISGQTKAHVGSVSSVVFSAGGLEIISGGDDGAIKFWDARSLAPTGQALSGHVGAVRGIARSADGQRIVSVGDDGTLRWWDAQGGKGAGQPLKEKHADGVAVLSVAYSPDGLQLASAGFDGRIRLWDAGSGAPLGRPLDGHAGPVHSVAYSPDGLRLVAGANDGRLRFWDTRSGDLIGQPYAGHHGWVSSVAYRADGQRIVSASGDGTLQQRDARNGQAVGQPLDGHAGPVRTAAYSPDGLRIAAGGDDGKVRVWDAGNGELMGQPLEGHEGAVRMVAFSPDGQRIVSAGADGTLRLWSTESRRPIGEPLRGHVGAVSSVGYSADGLSLVSGGEDGTLRLWSAGSGAPIGQPLDGHDGEVMSAAYSHNGMRIVSGGPEGTLRQWDAPAAWPAILCAKLTRNFSHAEWLHHVGKAFSYRPQCPTLPVPAE